MSIIVRIRVRPEWRSSALDEFQAGYGGRFYTTKAEYIAACEAAKEGVWIRNFLDDLGIFPASVKPLDLYCDNSGAIAQAKEPRNHHKVRHIDRKYHLIRKIVMNGAVELCKIHTDANVADPLTKPLPQPKHEGHVRAMGIRCLFD